MPSGWFSLPLGGAGRGSLGFGAFLFEVKIYIFPNNLFFMNGWVLHGRAMERTMLTNKYLAVNTHYFPFWKTLL